MTKYTVKDDGGIGERLKTAREYLGYTQSEMAERLGMSTKGYQHNEKSYSIPSALVIRSFSEFGISPLWVLNGTGDMKLDKVGREFYEENNFRNEDLKLTKEIFDLIYYQLGESNISESRKDKLFDKYSDSEISNPSSFHQFLTELKKPYEPYIFLPIINPSDESIFTDFGSFRELCEHHPVRRSWIYESKLNSELLKAVFPSDDAMAPTINQGEIAIIDGRTSVSGSGLYALSIQDKVLIRRLEHKLSGLNIITDNEHYSNETLSDEDAKNIEVLGRVVRIDSYR